ncbi:SHOCT domain-containing protein [Desulfobacter curvatus]|uniref:SHOCT domain-containing protein n=1 Tax=Desulfobacter curvatus TaxID=2290 RepID=UPI001FE2028D|nr:SHOCT domain-containing protein [Desulfobacter curvatus]
MMKNIISIGIGVLAIISVFTGSSIAGWGNAQAFYPGGHMMGGGYMGWSMIFFWVILLIVLVFVFRWLINLGQSNNTHQTALDVLKKRLANGEIDIEEFKEKSKFL